VSGILRSATCPAEDRGAYGRDAHRSTNSLATSDRHPHPKSCCHVLKRNRAAGPLTRDESGTLFSQTMGLVAVTSAVFALGCLPCPCNHTRLELGLFIGSFVALIGVSAVTRRSARLAVGLLFGFGFLIGAAVPPTVTYYAKADPQALWEAGEATGLLVAGFRAAGYASRRDLSGRARVLSWALIGLILFGVITALVQVPNGSVIYAVLGLVIFAGLTSYDFQRLRQSKDIRTSPLLAAAIFLDLLNVFLLFLSFRGQ
jgi:uncharacterized protein